ncbi:hypothetical protein IV203_037519 [Nitzschia inconspicua]|uniref:Uncharacterized protein n=1 Tax=Nitzschia inconspicua TaxID=303405 RepID=A0A9K3PY83_9STRA|nr:hypothetical protein IV203_037519 [Nitzschia inconspicua]
MRISDNLSAATTTNGCAAGLPGEVPRDLFICRDSEVEPQEAEDCDSCASSGNPLAHGEGTQRSVARDRNTNRQSSEYGNGKGQFLHHLHPHSIPGTSKEVMKAINDGAASYISHKQTPGSSTSKIVDQALHVVKSKGTSGRYCEHTPRRNEGDASQSSHASCNTTNHSVSTNATAASSTTASSNNNTVSPDIAPQPGPNFIAPSLRKIAKKRRKEPDRDGMERSSFHHTKSSKEYLRKAQEALKQQKELHDSSVQSSSDPVSEPMHSPRSNFRMLNQIDAAIAQTKIASAPFSPSQSCNNVVLTSKTEDNSVSTNPYGYEDPDTASTPTNTNPYGYEDPDETAAKILPAARRVGPARRRGSVTKYSLQAVQAAQKATERIMRLQGLNWKAVTENSTNNYDTPDRSTTPPRRLSHLRHAMESTLPPVSSSHQTQIEQSILSVPIRRRSIPLDSSDDEPYPDKSKNHVADNSHIPEARMEISDPYGYESTAIEREDASSGNQLGYDDPDAVLATSAQEASSSNPYGYDDKDTVPRQPIRRHPRARRRGSITKFSLDAAQTVKTLESELSGPSDDAKSAHPSKGSGDFIVALKPPAVGRPAGFGPKNRRRIGVLPTGAELDQDSTGGVFQLRQNHSSSSDHASPLRSAPRRTGSARSASSRHLARFSAPGRSDSYLSHGSVASWEDDADSLAPDMESLCSIHDRGDLGMDFAPVPPVSGLSPITPGFTPSNRQQSLSRTCSGKSDSDPSRKLQELQRSFSDRNNAAIITFPTDGDFPILPFAPTGGDSRSSARMPAPPVRRAPSHSASGNSATFLSDQSPTSVST